MEQPQNGFILVCRGWEKRNVGVYININKLEATFIKEMYKN